MLELANATSLSVIAPTPLWITFVLTSSVESLIIELSIASAEPWTSALIITGREITSPAEIFLNISSTFVFITLFFCICFLLKRYSAIFLALFSLSTTTKSSPARGLASKPKTSIGIDGRASLTFSPLPLINAFTFPHSEPDTNMSPIFRVPFCTRIVATEPLPFSSFVSITTPLAILLGFAFKFNKSACKCMASSNLSKLIFFNAEISTSSTSPLNFSTIIPWFKSSFLTLSGSADGRSILLIATIIGTFADLACAIDSTVWGLIPSSAATTRIIISVVFEPRARIFEKAAWPGVSINVIILLLLFIW